MTEPLTDAELDHLADRIADRLEARLGLQAELLTTDQACQVLKCGQSWFYELVRRPDFPQAVHIDGSRKNYYRRAELERWLVERTA